MFADDVIAEVFELLCNLARVRFIANFEDHLDADAAQRRKPYRALMLNLDNVRSGIGDIIKQSRQPARTVVHQKLQNYVTAFAYEHLFDNARKQRPIDISAA